MADFGRIDMDCSRADAVIYSDIQRLVAVSARSSRCYSAAVAVKRRGFLRLRPDCALYFSSNIRANQASSPPAPRTGVWALSRKAGRDRFVGDQIPIMLHY